jgi:predicted RNA-binding protein YlxR (DUF448 family)
VSKESKENVGSLPTHDSRLMTSHRTCIVTRLELPKEALIRFVVGPNQQVVPDLSGKLPGRGIYVTCSKLLVAEAIAKRAFSKAAKAQVEIPAGLLAAIEVQLARRVLDALSLARKAGQVVMGFEKVEEALKSGKTEALLHASDAGEDGLKKLAFYTGPSFDFLSREQLSGVLGRENAVHAAITHGPAAQFFIEVARRFALFLA